MGVQTEQYLQVTKLLVLVDGGTGATTLTGAHAVATTSLTVASSTGFLANDPFRVGDAEDSEVYVVASIPNATTIVIASPGLKRAHASASVVQEQVADQMGPISDAGFKLALSREATDQFVASQRLPFAILKGYGAVRGEFAFASLTLYNLALAMGAARTTVLGVGTVADPLALITSGSNFGTISNVNVIIEGQLNNLTPIRAELYGVQFDYTGISVSLQRGAPSTVPVKMVAGGGAILDKSASPFTGTTTYVGSNASVLDGLDDFGYWAAHATLPAATTVASGGAAGANTVVLTSGTNYAAGDWVKYGAGNTVEFHQVDSVAINTLTNRTRFLRAQAAATAVTRQSLNQLGGISTDGVTLALGGAVTEIRSGLREMAVGLRPGNASASFDFALTSLNLTAFAIAAGMAIPSGNVLAFFSGIGAVPVDGIYSTGLMQGGRRLWVNMWGTQMDTSGLEATFSNSGEPPQIPAKGRPLSGIQVIDTA